MLQGSHCGLERGRWRHYVDHCFLSPAHWFEFADVSLHLEVPLGFAYWGQTRGSNIHPTQSLWSRLQGWLWSWIHPPPPVQCAESQPIDPKIIELLQNFVDHCKYRDIQVKPSTRTTLIYIINWILTEEEVRPGFSYLRDGVFAALADVAHNLTSDPDWLTAYFYIALHVSERPILYCLQRNAFPLPAKEVHQQLIEKIERYSWPERAQMKTCVLSGNSLYI